jgi:hypothetical protein
MFWCSGEVNSRVLFFQMSLFKGMSSVFLSLSGRFEGFGFAALLLPLFYRTLYSLCDGLRLIRIQQN